MPKVPKITRPDLDPATVPAKTTRAGRPKKIQDEELIRLNNLGLSKSTMGQMFDCHPSVVGQRLKDLNLATADERKSFIERVYEELTSEHQMWLMNRLSSEYTITEYLRDLLKSDYAVEAKLA